MRLRRHLRLSWPPLAHAIKRARTHRYAAANVHTPVQHAGDTASSSVRTDMQTDEQWAHLA